MDLQTIIPTSHILEWRRHIHQHPELSHQEKETAAYIRSQLEKIGVDEIVSPHADKPDRHDSRRQTWKDGPLPRRY